MYAFEYINIDKNGQKHTQRTLFACYNTPYLTESDLKKAYPLHTEHLFFTRKINISKLWFLMKIVCIGLIYFSERIIIKDGKDIPNGPFLQWSAIISHLLCVYCNIHR